METAVVETAGEAEAAANGAAGLPGDEETNVWPSAVEEAAFLAETRARGEPELAAASSAAKTADDEADERPLPKLDELVERIPKEARELLDDLFRAKFTAVRRVKLSDLKN